MWIYVFRTSYRLSYKICLQLFKEKFLGREKETHLYDEDNNLIERFVKKETISIYIEKTKCEMWYPDENVWRPLCFCWEVLMTR